MLRCLVPFCSHTTRRFDPPSEWVCGEHWRLVPLMLKRLLSRAKRRRDRKLFDLAWQRAKQRAIEVAAGISR